MFSMVEHITTSLFRGRRRSHAACALGTRPRVFICYDNVEGAEEEEQGGGGSLGREASEASAASALHRRSAAGVNNCGSRERNDLCFLPLLIRSGATRHVEASHPLYV